MNHPAQPRFIPPVSGRVKTSSVPLLGHARVVVSMLVLLVIGLTTLAVVEGVLLYASRLFSVITNGLSI